MGLTWVDAFAIFWTLRKRARSNAHAKLCSRFGRHRRHRILGFKCTGVSSPPSSSFTASSSSSHRQVIRATRQDDGSCKPRHLSLRSTPPWRPAIPARHGVVQGGSAARRSRRAQGDDRRQRVAGIESRRIDEGDLARLCAKDISHLFRLMAASIMMRCSRWGRRGSIGCRVARRANHRLGVQPCS
jgi:hypothetical protein